MSTAVLPAINPPPMLGSDQPLLTAEEFADRYDGQYVELVNGILEVLPVPKSYSHGITCMRVGAKLLAYADENDCGTVASNDTWMRTTRSPDSVRGPDVMFLSYRRKAKGTLTHDMIDVSPEVVVEVKSPSDSWPKMMAKAKEYLDADVLAVLLINPETRSVAICRANASPMSLAVEDVLSLPDILPGFSVNVGSLFV